MVYDSELERGGFGGTALLHGSPGRVFPGAGASPDAGFGCGESETGGVAEPGTEPTSGGSGKADCAGKCTATRACSGGSAIPNAGEAARHGQAADDRASRGG